jgi:hypothetical protein
MSGKGKSKLQPSLLSPLLEKDGVEDEQPNTDQRKLQVGKRLFLVD